MREWTLVLDIPEGHRIFKGDDNNFYVCDRSGSTPDLSDDGPLIISGNIELSFAPGHRLLACLRVWSEREKRNCFVGLNPQYVHAVAAIEDLHLRVIGPKWMKALCGIIETEG